MALDQYRKSTRLLNRKRSQKTRGRQPKKDRERRPRKKEVMGWSMRNSGNEGALSETRFNGKCRGTGESDEPDVGGSRKPQARKDDGI